MNWRIALAVLSVVALMATSCRSGDGPRPEPWHQIYSDTRNDGFNAVPSAAASASMKKWVATVGQLVYSSPVVGPDGTVYIGNVAGQAVAINPDGTERWRRRLGSGIVAAPAVHVENGEIIFPVQHPRDEERFLTFLYKLSPMGNIVAVSTEQGVTTTAAPKIWREFVFLTGGGNIYVFDRSTLALVAKAFYGLRCALTVCAGGFGWLQDVVHGLRCMLTLTLPENCFPPAPLGYIGPLNEPSLAIVDAPAVVDDPEHPIVVASGGSCATAWRFSPRAMPFESRLQLLWEHRLRGGDCPDSGHATSPAIVVGTQAVFGDQHGRVTSLDVKTGIELWKRDTHTEMSAPPVAFLRQIYVVMSRTLMVLDSDGTELYEVTLQGYGQGAALSLNHVYVTTDQGIHTFELDARQNASFDASTASDTRYGLAMPGIALAPDGTLYVSTPTGQVHAYGSPPR
jgi:outer membrane protein assembly factor BamB